jgi:peptidoglycan hydrolase-like protein with peptidoglycan-binding domain
VPRAARKSRTAARDDETVDRRMPRVFILQALGWSHRDAVGCIVGTAAAILILVNVLWLQSGPHPAPMFKKGIVHKANVSGSETVAALPRPRPPEQAASPEPPTAAVAPARAAAEVITDIQRELVRRGFYDGAVDGRYGPKTDAAIRDFEHAAGLKPSTEPGEGLLRAIRGSSAHGRRAPGRTAAPAANDPIAALLASGRASADRVRGVQRALTDYGYGQIDPTGVVDSETKAAIAKFERARSLPVTGQISDRLARELASITGRPLE